MNPVKVWAADTAVRAVKTSAQALVGMLGVGATGLIGVDWKADLAVSGLAGLTCVLHNVQSFPTPRAVAPSGQAVP